jgi:hypothetical protein
LTTSEAELEGVDQERKSVVVVAGVEMAVAAWEVERLMKTEMSLAAYMVG